MLTSCNRRPVNRRIDGIRQGRFSPAAVGRGGAFDPASLSSNSFEIEWPPRSGRVQSFPEIDRTEWFDLETAKTKLLSGQAEFIDRITKARR